MAGRVTSEPYISHEPIEYEVSPDNIVTCEYKIRRNIIWSRRYARESIPYELENSFRNTMAVFEIGSEKKVDIVNHWLTPIHIKGSDILISSRIENDASIGNHPIARFSVMLDELELLSSYLAHVLESEDKEISIKEYESYQAEYGHTYEYKLTTQQAFMSPGDHFIRLPGDIKQLKLYAILFALLFQANVSFAGDSAEVVSEEQLYSIEAIVEALKDKNDFENVIDRLKLKLPKENKDVINPETNTDELFPAAENSPDMPI